MTSDEAALDLTIDAYEAADADLAREPAGSPRLPGARARRDLYHDRLVRLLTIHRVVHQRGGRLYRVEGGELHKGNSYHRWR